ncbi:hypothetical protein ABE527_14245 [Brucella sp. TWI432]
MNQFACYARPLPGGSYWAMTRMPRDGHPKPILGKGAKPIIYPSKEEALAAAVANLLRYLNGDYQRGGEVLLAHRKKADALFKPVGKSVRTLP